MTNSAQSHIIVETQSVFMENFFSLERAILPPIAVFIALSYLFSAMSRLYLYVILERDHFLLE